MARIEDMALCNRRGLLGGIGASALLSMLPSAAFAQANSRFPKVAKVISDYVTKRKVSGMVAALGLGDAPLETVASGTLGFSNPRKVDDDTLWRIYSMTKPVTGMAAMMCIEDGLFTLDTPLYDILPKYRDMTVLRKADGPLDQVDPAKQPITIRMLLTHSAGLGYSIVSQGPIRDAYIARGINPGRVTRLQRLPMFRGEPAKDFKSFADNLAELPLVYQPGARWSYSIGLDLLGYVIEQASGKRYEDFLSERLFQPLGMTSTFFTVPRDRADELAVNYGVFRDMPVPIDPGKGSIYLDKHKFPFGGAGLVSTARDYDRFLHMLMNFGRFRKERVMAESTARTAMSNLLLPETNTDNMIVPGSKFGAGGMVGFGGPGGSDTSFGWAGAAGTIAFVDHGRRIRAGGYTQYMPYTAYDFPMEFIAGLSADLAALAMDEAA